MNNQEEIILSDDQQAAYDGVLAWFGNPDKTPVLTLGGYAGTGKTTLIKKIITAIGVSKPIAVCSFTGKAVAVLKSKGVWQAMTLHRLMYRPRSEFGVVTFDIIDRSEFGYDLVILDEASMISTELFADLLSFNVPILAVGDHGQLEPVGDDPGLMKSPDITLTQIHRQAEGSGIIAFANEVREGIDPVYATKSDDVTMIKATVAGENIIGYDQIICGFNKTRDRLNKMVRKQLGFIGDIVVGERIICLQNNRDMGMFNGMQATIKNIKNEYTAEYLVDLELDDGTVMDAVPIDKATLSSGKVSWENGRPSRRKIYATYGYVVTAHKAQGSEWDKVLVVEELWPDKWSTQRWRYTAATRAAVSLHYTGRIPSLKPKARSLSDLSRDR